MKRYHYNSENYSQAESKSLTLLVPLVLVGIVVGLMVIGSVGGSFAGQVEPQKGEEVQPSLAEDRPTVAPTNYPPVIQDQAAQRLTVYAFARCGSIRDTCVVDGDTIWLEGEKIRIADIDTPEISQPQCDYERALGDEATARLVALLNEGPFELRTIGRQDEDRYGRKLRVIMRDGRSLGDQLVEEGLARTWSGRREPWC